MRDIKGIELLQKLEDIWNREDPAPTQPQKCKGCVWGRWEGTKQFCSKQQCVKT